MKQGRFEKKMAARKSSKKLAVLLLALALLIGGTIGGTLAYLKDVTTPVTNTFVVGNVGDLSLSETENDYAYKDANKNYIIIPGVNITKDPTVTYEGNNIAAYIFVKVEAEDWAFSNGTYTKTDSNGGKMEWAVDGGWTKLAEESDEYDVYYRTVDANAQKGVWSVISGNVITVNDKITTGTISSYASSLTFTAYAIQKDGFTKADGTADPAAAWAAASANS